jgi:hypothetical protein
MKIFTCPNCQSKKLIEDKPTHFACDRCGHRFATVEKEGKRVWHPVQTRKPALTVPGNRVTRYATIGVGVLVVLLAILVVAAFASGRIAGSRRATDATPTAMPPTPDLVLAISQTQTATVSGSATRVQAIPILSSPNNDPNVESIKLTGKGTETYNLDLNRLGGIAVLGTRHEGGEFLVVTFMDDQNREVLPPIMVSGDYSGERLLMGVKRIRVQSIKEWEIKLAPLSSYPRTKIPSSLEEVGDSVVVLDGQAGKLAIKGNEKKEAFKVIAYRDNGKGRLAATTLVVATDVYDGSVTVPDGTKMVELLSPGKWTMDIQPK